MENYDKILNDIIDNGLIFIIYNMKINGKYYLLNNINLQFFNISDESAYELAYKFKIVRENGELYIVNSSDKNIVMTIQYGQYTEMNTVEKNTYNKINIIIDKVISKTLNYIKSIFIFRFTLGGYGMSVQTNEVTYPQIKISISYLGTAGNATSFSYSDELYMEIIQGK